jgi:hypothetical protein
MNEPQAAVAVVAPVPLTKKADHARILASLDPVDLSRVERLQDCERWTLQERESRIVRHAEKVSKNLLVYRCAPGYAVTTCGDAPTASTAGGAS